MSEIILSSQENSVEVKLSMTGSDPATGQSRQLTDAEMDRFHKLYAEYLTATPAAADPVERVKAQQAANREIMAKVLRGE